MIIAIIFLLFASLFFSGSETALTATNKIKLQMRARHGDKKSEKLLNLVSKPSEFITTILIGNNIANILLPTLVTAIAIDYGINIGIATAILTVTIIVFSEVIPKSIAATFPERIAYMTYPVINFFIVIFKPITFILNKLTGAISKVLSKGDGKNVSVSKDELRAIVDIAGSEGLLEKEESYRIKGALDFRNLNVKDVLRTPRVEIVALPNNATYEEVRDVVLKNNFTRYPVFHEEIDNIVGIFHSKQLILWSMEPKQTLNSLSDTEPLIVHEFHTVERVLRRMTKEKKHMAIVLDEYGGTEGIITHEDIVETMIGLEIEDELDTTSTSVIEKITETELICDGKITLHYLNSIFNTDVPEEEDVLAGYLLKEFNQFPNINDSIERNNLTFKVLEIEGRTISKVQIIK